MTFLDDVEQRLIAASPRPWSYSTVASIGGGTLYDATRSIASLHYEAPAENDGRIVRLLPNHEADANGDLIAHAPADLAALIDFAREVKAALNHEDRPREPRVPLHVYWIEQALIRLEERA